jgi:hypothetical protein
MTTMTNTTRNEVNRKKVRYLSMRASMKTTMAGARWAVGALLLVGACRHRPDATAANLANFTAAMNAYLQSRGDLCIARAEWPVDVTLADFAARTRDAVQMPVLERLGLVDSAALSGASKVTRYRLTEKGRQQYLDRGTHRPVSAEGPNRGDADFCVAHLTLDRIVGWEIHPGEPKGESARDLEDDPKSASHAAPPTDATLSYTFHVVAPAWTRDPAFERAFPAVSRVVRGDGVAQLTETLTLTPAGWTANELLPAAAPAAVATGP